MKDRIYQWIANHLLSDRFLYWATIRGVARCTSQEFSSTYVGDLSAMGVIERL